MTFKFISLGNKMEYLDIVFPTISKENFEFFKEEYKKKYFKELEKKVIDDYNTKTVYPPFEQIFYSFQFDLSKTRVLILGQDPYHQKGEAMGLSFSVTKNIKTPPSLLNIFQELSDDMGIERTNPDLSDWADQFVLLLNSTLTVVQGSPNSHEKYGWQTFTDAVIKYVSDKSDCVVFMLWGKFAQKKSTLIDSKKHLILTAAHPSPLARGAFFGSKHFSKCNDYLEKKGYKKINW